VARRRSPSRSRIRRATPARVDVGFTDTLPSGLVVANPASVGGTCANAAAATIGQRGNRTITVVRAADPRGRVELHRHGQRDQRDRQFNASCAGTRRRSRTGRQPRRRGHRHERGDGVVRRGRRPHDRQGVLADDDRRGGTTTLTFTYANPAGAALASNLGAVDNLPSGWSSPIPRTSVAPVPTPRLPTIATPGGSTITTTNLQVPGGRIDLHGDGRRHQRDRPVQRELRGIAVGFTNGSGNLSLTNVIDAVTPSCVAVLGGSGRRDAGHPRADVARRRARAARLLVGFAGLRAMRPKENGRSRGRLRG
jgi:hypothetical protein